MKEGDTKKLIITAKAFLLALVLVGCGKKDNIKNYDAQIREALNLIESGYFTEAEKILLDVKSQDPQNCQVSYGLVFISINKLMTSINSIISLFSGVGGLSPALHRIHGKSLSKLIHTLLSPLLYPIDEISRNIKIVIEKKCSINVAVPVTLGSDTEPISKFYIGQKGGPARRWGITEASFLGALANILNSFINTILSINLDIDLAKLIEIQLNLGNIGLQTNPQNTIQDQSAESIFRGFATQQFKIFSSAIEVNPADPVGIFSSLAYIIDTSPDLLKLNHGAEHMIDRISDQLSYSFKLLHNFIESIPQNDKNNILAYEDVGEKGLSVDDIIYLNIYNYPDFERGLFIKIGNINLKVDSTLVSLLVRPILDKDVRERYQNMLIRFSKAFDILDPNISDEERWIYAEDVRQLLPFFEIKNTIRFNPKRFVEGLKSNPEGLRSLLPFWTDLNRDGFPDFIIEAESARDKEKFCFEKQERTKPFVLGPLVQIQREDVVRQIGFFYSKGEMTPDFSCELQYGLKSNSNQKYSVSITAYLDIKNFSITLKNYGLIFLVSPCDRYDVQVEKNFLCYNMVGKNAVPHAFIEGKKYNLTEVMQDGELFSALETKVIKSYTKLPDSEPQFYTFVEPNTINVIAKWTPELYQNASSFVLKVYNSDDIFAIPITFAMFDKSDKSGQVSIDITKYTNEFHNTPRSLVLKFSYIWEDCSSGSCVEYSTLIKKTSIIVSYPSDFGFENSNCTITKWTKNRSAPFSSYSPELNFISDEFYKIECRQKVIEFDKQSFQRSAEVEIDSCFLPFNRITFLLPVLITSNRFLPESFEVYTSKREFTPDEIKIMSLGINAGYYIKENISLSKTNGKNTVFYYFFTNPDILRVETFRNFPQYTKLVIGCHTVMPRCFFNQDDKHFPPRILFKGKIYESSINNDCMFPEGVWSLYYVAWRDPTFLNSIEVNLGNLGKLCPKDPTGWVKPDQYTINKAVADLLSRTLSPINSLVLQIIGLISGGSNIGLASGEFCQ